MQLMAKLEASIKSCSGNTIWVALQGVLDVSLWLGCSSRMIAETLRTKSLFWWGNDAESYTKSSFACLLFKQSAVPMPKLMPVVRLHTRFSFNVLSRCFPTNLRSWCRNLHQIQLCVLNFPQLDVLMQKLTHLVARPSFGWLKLTS